MPGSGDVLSPELRRPIRKIFTDTMISNDMERYAVGADIGGSHICSAVVDLTTGEICGEPLSGKVDCDAGAGEILGAWADNIRQSIAASGLKAVRRVGFAFPGPFDYEHGVSLIRGVNKFERIYGLDISESLFPLLRRSGAEEFRYVNDASAFALGECLGGAACDARRVVALTLGTGVGSGFVSDRKLVTSGDEVPADGWVYCLPFGGGIVDEAFSTRGIIRRYEELTGETLTGATPIRLRAVFSTSTAKSWRSSRVRSLPVSTRTYWCSAEIFRGLIRFSDPLWSGVSPRTESVSRSALRPCSTMRP